MNLPQTERARLRLALMLPLFLLPLTACGDDAVQAEKMTTGGETPAASSKEVERDILDVINAVTPLAATVPVADKNSWYGRQRDLMERMRTKGQAHGLEALRVFHERKNSILPVRKGLLDIAAHNAPEECGPLLKDLVEIYGEDLGLRTAAAELMGTATPELAIEVLEPILKGQRRGVTLPQLDLILESWNKACKTLERDPIPVICEVAIDPTQVGVARHAAIKLLGTIKSSQGQQALERALIETGTDGMIRRFAAQSLAKTTEPEVLCEIINRTLQREQDPSFVDFLTNMDFKYCR